MKHILLMDKEEPITQFKAPLTHLHRTIPLHLTVADMGGTVAAVSHTGEILWDANLSGTLPHTPTIGDVDGDGQVMFGAVH